MTKYLFSSIKECPLGGRIPNLYNEDDIVVSSSANLAHVCNIFYSKLYASLVPDELKKGLLCGATKTHPT